jgi:TRAP-type C4-dicarboxylate transport system permease small subunit
MVNLLHKVDHVFSKIIESLLVSNVIVLIFLACYSILSRWMQWTNLWVDPLNRHLVLLLIFLGSTVAIDKKKHLKIDALGITLEKNLSPIYLKLIDLILMSLICVIVYFLWRSGVHFWRSELEYPVDAFLGLKQYHLAVIIPLGFLLMLIKYGLHLLLHATQLFTKESAA